MTLNFTDRSAIRRKLSEHVGEELSKPNARHADDHFSENQRLKQEVEGLKMKMLAFQSKDKYMEAQIWELRKLVKRVAEEGYVQLRSIELEKEAIQKELDHLKASYVHFQNHLAHFERMVLYWNDFVNND